MQTSFTVLNNGGATVVKRPGNNLDVTWGGQKSTTARVNISLQQCSNTVYNTNYPSSNYSVMSILGETPADITGMSNVPVCQNTPITYSTAAMSIPIGINRAADGYEWTIPVGWKFSDGNVSNGTPRLFLGTNGRTQQFTPDCKGSGAVVVRAYTNAEGRGTPHYSLPRPLPISRSPNISISTPPPSGIRCGVPFTASVPELSCATSYNWTVPSGWTISGTGRTRTITPLGTSGTISVNIPVTGGCTITTSQNIMAPFSHVINGPSLICSTGSFSVGTLPAGSSISWSSSNPSGLSINSSTGSVTRVNGYNGPITVTVHISNQCGTGSFTRNVWVGTPHITNMRVNNQPVFPSQPVSLCPGNHFLNVTPVGGNVGVATWTVPSGVPHWIGNNTMDFTFPSSMSSITISARASNSCGQGANYNFFLTRQTWGCPSSFAMVAYPNPTSDILNIEMMPVTAEVSKEDAPLIESAILLNSEGREMAKGYREGSKIVFDVRSLKKGFYFIHVTVDGELIREQIQIE